MNKLYKLEAHTAQYEGIERIKYFANIFFAFTKGGQSPLHISLNST